MKRYTLSVLLALWAIALQAQGLFESSMGGSDDQEPAYFLNGYARTDVFANETDYRSVFSELSLKFETAQSNYGKGFVEMRIKQSLLDKENPQWTLREAYADLFLGKIDLRIGQQIIVWGRADGFNPTNNLTPHAYGVFSPEEDDSRLSNFVVSGTYNAYPWRINVNWIPVYRASKLPLDKNSTPFISWDENDYPDPSLSESSLAMKISYEAAALDGSLSYFRGYHKSAGLEGYILPGGRWSLAQRAHTTQVWGADFSTTMGAWGVRGEFALTLPEDKENSQFFIPEDQIEYTVGVDHEWGNFSLIVQYIGKYVMGYENHMPATGSKLEAMLYHKNNLLFGQTDEWLHSASVRPAAKMLHENLEVEMLTLYNFTTEEIFLKPMADYALTDNIALIAGAQLYIGPDDSLFGLLEHKVNAAFLECKVSF